MYSGNSGFMNYVNGGGFGNQGYNNVGVNNNYGYNNANNMPPIPFSSNNINRTNLCYIRNHSKWTEIFRIIQKDFIEVKSWTYKSLIKCANSWYLTLLNSIIVSIFTQRKCRDGQFPFCKWKQLSHIESCQPCQTQRLTLRTNSRPDFKRKGQRGLHKLARIKIQWRRHNIGWLLKTC